MGVKRAATTPTDTPTQVHSDEFRRTSDPLKMAALISKWTLANSPGRPPGQLGHPASREIRTVRHGGHMTTSELGGRRGTSAQNPVGSRVPLTSGLSDARPDVPGPPTLDLPQVDLSPCLERSRTAQGMVRFLLE